NSPQSGKETRSSRVPLSVWRDGKTFGLQVPPGKLGVMVAQKPAPQALRDQREGDRAIRASRGSSHRRLEGSGREVRAIASLFADPVVLLRSEASEQRLDELAPLARFRYLHFATHGDLNSQLPMQSALILAQDRLPDPVQQMLAGKPAYNARLRR